MEYRHLPKLRAIVTTLGLTRSAAELRYVQSVVTARVKALEEELGLTVFDRLGQPSTLTDAGERLPRCANRILHQRSAFACAARNDGWREPWRV